VGRGDVILIDMQDGVLAAVAKEQHL